MSSLLLTVIKHFWPSHWFKAISREAEQMPAVVSGGVVIWITIIALSYIAYDYAQATEIRFTSMQVILADNTKELECSKQDRAIAAKAREAANLRLLIERTTDASEQRLLDGQLITIQRELANLERTYSANCL